MSNHEEYTPIVEVEINTDTAATKRINGYVRDETRLFSLGIIQASGIIKTDSIMETPK
jgi:hypothetical protein